MKRTIFFFFSFFLFSIFVKAQSGFSTKTYFKATAIEDSSYGIMLYEKYNKSIGGKEKRKIDGKFCNTWVEDYYPNNQLLHRGFYVEGELQMYKNYYLNGNEERNFKKINDYKCNLKLYHSNGNIRTEIDYSQGFEYKTVDYYRSGRMEYYEELDKSGDFFIKKENYFESGQLTKSVELVDKKKKIYSSKEYYESGILKEEGMLIYKPNIRDYVKNEVWKNYDENGNLKLEQYYILGEMNKATKH